MNISEILYNCIAPLMGQYWFISVYCIIYVLSPFLNIYLYKITGNQLKKCIAILAIIVPGIFTIWVESPSGTLGIAIYDYLLVAVVKKEIIHITKRKAIGYFLFVSSLVLILKIAGSILLGKPIGIVRLTGRCSGIQVLVGFLLFVIFKDMKLTKGNRIINLWSKNTLGVYLIHENTLLGAFIRDDILKIKDLYFYKLFPIALLITFITTTLIDKVMLSIEKRLFKFISKKSSFDKIDKWLKDI